jgi:hypothetical protein
LVFELFFAEELHSSEIHLFDACDNAGVAKLGEVVGIGLENATRELSKVIFANNHPIYAMLFDLQGLEVVRIIEGRE